jgi:hypothetical protein
MSYTARFHCIASLAAALLIQTAGAQTNTISFTNSTTANGLNSYFNLALGKFNTSLGSLDSVTITVHSAVLGGSFIIGAPNPALDQDYEDAAGRITIRQATTNSLGFTQLGETSFNVTTTPAPVITVPGGATNTFSVTPLIAFTNTSPNGVQSIPSTFWAAYSDPAGIGDVIFQVKNRPDITISGGDFFLNATDFTAQTTMSVSYTYVVPEPSTRALLVLSAAGAGLVAARRRKS